MRINHNTTAYLNLNSLNQNERNLAVSTGRLSSGKKITHAKQGPAVLAQSKRMNAQIDSLKQATANAKLGINFVETADGALQEVHDMLQRINELAVRAANGVWQEEDNKAMDEEAQALMKEITRIARDTEFNGQKLLDGTWDLKAYNNSENVRVGIYTDGLKADTNYSIPALDVTWEWNDKRSRWEISDVQTDPADPDRKVDAGGVTGSSKLPAGSKVTGWDVDRIFIEDEHGFYMRLDLEGSKDKADDPNVDRNRVEAPTGDGITMELMNMGSNTVQIGSNQYQDLDIRIKQVSLRNIGIDTCDLLNEENASDFLSKMRGAINFISGVRGELGAYQNRLEHTISSLDISVENMTSAYSSLIDVDMAEEMVNYSTQQVLTQAATTILAQANQRPAEVMQLLGS